MNDLEALRDAIDELETGLGSTPDLGAVHREARRLRRRHRLLQGVGLAAAATTIVALSLGPATHDMRSSFFGSTTTATPGGPYVILTTDGWGMTGVAEGMGLESASFEKGPQRLELQEYPDSVYAGRLDNYSRLNGTQSTVMLGRSATMGAYTSDDHAAILPPVDGTFIEVRGTGMGSNAFQTLLGDLTYADRIAFVRAAPKESVTPANHDQAIAGLLRGVDLPPDFTAADIDLGGVTSVDVARSDVAGQVGCAWIDVYGGGTTEEREAAIAAFDASHQWLLLLQLAKVGAFSQVFWEIGDELKNGVSTDGSALDLQHLKNSIC